MSGKEKLDSDYQSSLVEIEKLASEALRSLKETANGIKSEAAEVGESLERSFSKR